MIFGFLINDFINFSPGYRLVAGKMRRMNLNKNNGSLSSRAPDNFTKFWAMHFRVYFIIQHKQLNTRKCLSPNLLQIKMYVQFCYFNVMVFNYNALLTNSRYRPSTFLMKKKEGVGAKNFNIKNDGWGIFLNSIYIFVFFELYSNIIYQKNPPKTKTKQNRWRATKLLNIAKEHLIFNSLFNWKIN